MGHPPEEDSIRRSQFSEKIVGILKEYKAGGNLGSQCRRHGISPQTFYRGNQKYGGLDRVEVRRLKALEVDNARLERWVAEQTLNAQTLKELFQKTGGARPAAGWVWKRFAHLERRSCRLIGIGRSTARPRRKRGTDEGVLRQRLRELATERLRFGYRRLHALLRRAGVPVLTISGSRASTARRV